MSLSKNINPSLVLVQPRKIRPFITERLLMGRKESNQTNKQTENKTTQTDDSFDEYLKKQEKSPSEKTPKETPKGKQDKNTSSPRLGPAFKPATLEMMKKEEERKKKEEKDRINQQQKEERRKQYHKDKQENELKEKEEAEKAQQNSYSVLHKDDTEVCMEEESVVFTVSASSDHLP